jgi:hypothetical protein
MVLVKADKNSEAGVMPSKTLLADMGQYNEELRKAGVLLAGEGLHPSSKGARVKFSGAKRTVVDGPFPKRCPNPMEGETEIEIRQVFEADDFGAVLTPELRESEQRMRDQIAAREK